MLKLPAYSKSSKRKKDAPKSYASSPFAEYGTDEEFRVWVREQPSCLDGAMPCIAAHVRRAKDSGTAFKPPYRCVPLTDDQHNEQSWYSEASCLNRYNPRPRGWTNLAAKEWFDEQADITVKAWVESTCKNRKTRG